MLDLLLSALFVSATLRSPLRRHVYTTSDKSSVSTRPMTEMMPPSLLVSQFAAAGYAHEDQHDGFRRCAQRFH